MFGGYGHGSQCDSEHFRHIATSRALLKENTFKCPCLNKSSREHRKYCALYRSPRFVSGIAGCEVHHASAGGDRLIVLTTLGVADYDGASVLVGCDKTFS